MQLFLPHQRAVHSKHDSGRATRKMKTCKVNVEFSCFLPHTLFSPSTPKTLSALLPRELSANIGFQVGHHHRQHMRDDGCVLCSQPKATARSLSVRECKSKVGARGKFEFEEGKISNISKSYKMFSLLILWHLSSPLSASTQQQHWGYILCSLFSLPSTSLMLRSFCCSPWSFKWCMDGEKAKKAWAAQNWGNFPFFSSYNLQHHENRSVNEFSMQINWTRVSSTTRARQPKENLNFFPPSSCLPYRKLKHTNFTLMRVGKMWKCFTTAKRVDSWHYTVFGIYFW